MVKRKAARRVEKREYDELVALATAERVNVSSIVRRAIARFLEGEAPTAARPRRTRGRGRA
jgi:post-segregation antitoxin (ccd killing protein)